MKTIAFVVPYFGRFNNYFQLWLNSCSNNPTIDWLIFTDDVTEFDYPKNVHVFYVSLNDVKNRIETIFEQPVKLEYPYKLCDFKPFYGVIFKDELQKYDFWGYCDVDLIWGNIRKFLTDDLLSNYDKIFEYGHCSLIRNNDELNWAFKKKCNNVVDYKKVLSYPINFYFDEQEQMGVIFDEYYGKTYYKGILYYDVNSMHLNFYPAPSMKIANCKPSVFEKTADGLWAISYEKHKQIKKEYLYAHFQKRNMKIEIPLLTERYLIVSNCFTSLKKLDEKTYRNFIRKKPFYWYPIKSVVLYCWDSIFDTASKKIYYRGRVKKFFDCLFFRKRKQWYKELYSK